MKTGYYPVFLNENGLLTRFAGKNRVNPKFYGLWTCFRNHGDTPDPMEGHFAIFIFQSKKPYFEVVMSQDDATKVIILESGWIP